jgi:hypothetical protein
VSSHGPYKLLSRFPSQNQKGSDDLSVCEHRVDMLWLCFRKAAWDVGLVGAQEDYSGVVSLTSVS